MTNITILNAISEVEKKIKDAGATKTGKGNYSKIYSLDQLQNFIYQYGGDLKFRWGKITVDIINDTKVLIQVEAIWHLGEMVEVVPITMPGGDLNNISFAAGKGITYGKRYYLLGMLGLGSEDLEPDNPEVAKKELITAINNKFKDNEELKTAVETAWKTKHKSDLDLTKLPLDKLQSITRQIGV